jgi:endonuclease/exonuclease/phosphatase family metal-dependent hydrolase
LKPDIALVQETNYRANRDADLQAFIQQAFGTGFHIWREPNRPKPNSIVSRWPILAKGVWEDSAAPDREFVWARINIPGPVDLWAVSVHLLTNDSKRPAEARELVAFVRKSIPAGDFLVIGGDLNTDSMRDRAFDALDDVIAIPEILPADARGRTGTNASRQKPYDHVLVNGALHKLRTPVVIGASKYPNGLVFDSRVYRPLSEVAPVRSGDSGAPQMQHMAVVRDFLVPTER